MLQDLVKTIGGVPDCLMQPKTNGPKDVLQLSHYLDVLEAREGIAPGTIKIHSISTETAVAMFTLGDYAKARLPRSEEHTSELQSLMRLSYAVFCFKKKKKQQH